MKQPPSAERQILALLTGKAFGLACEWTGKNSLDGTEYGEVFTVTAQAVHEYVRQHGLPKGPWSDRRQSSDGLYLIESDDVFKVYYQERGIEFDETLFGTREEAEAFLVDQLVAHSGAGLYVAHDQRSPSASTSKGWLSRLLGPGSAAQ